MNACGVNLSIGILVADFPPSFTIVEGARGPRNSAHVVHDRVSFPGRMQCPSFSRVETIP
jgi:hypothetical protein